MFPSEKGEEVSKVKVGVDAGVSHISTDRERGDQMIEGEESERVRNSEPHSMGVPPPGAF